MCSPRLLKQSLIGVILAALLGLASCGLPTGLGTQPTATPSLTPQPPTPTPVPMAATVNGQAITEVEFQAEVKRYQDAQSELGKTVSLEDASQTVLNDLVDQTLLAQGAQAEGFIVDEATLQSRLEALAAQIGGKQKLSDWESKYGYTDESFQSALKRDIASAWMRDTIVNAVPTTAEQVHVQQILLYNQDEAQQVLAQLNSGSDFDSLASQYDPATHGDLGWFPRGYLLEPKIEEAAFSLQPGQISDIIATDVGYHIIKVLERDPQHPLSPDAYLTAQSQALSDWLRQQHDKSAITLAP
jgi:parvulin-like peptidyl-prolyl isomerase